MVCKVGDKMSELRAAIFRGIEAEIRGILVDSGMSLKIHDPLTNSVRSHYFTFKGCFSTINIGVDTLAGTAMCYIDHKPRYFELANPAFPDNIIAVIVREAWIQAAIRPTLEVG